MPAYLENSGVATGLEKISFHSIPKGNAKECSNYHTITLISHSSVQFSCSVVSNSLQPHESQLISHSSKIMLKILQVRLQQYMNRELPDVQASFRTGRRTRVQIANICWITKKASEFQKNIYFCITDYAKALSVWITINCGKFWKGWDYQTTWLAS